MFLAPITWDWSAHPYSPGRSPVSLGQSSGLIIHNPTTVVVFPFALLLFWFSWRDRYGLAALTAAVQCLIKPNFALVPATAVLITQFMTSETLGTGIIIDPFRAWSHVSDNIPLSAVRSLAFPLAFAVVYFGVSEAELTICSPGASSRSRRRST